MSKALKTIEKNKKRRLAAHDHDVAVVIDRLRELIEEVSVLHPNLYMFYGMGSWGFSGTIKFRYDDETEADAESETDDLFFLTDIDYYDGEGRGVIIATTDTITDAMREIVMLSNHLCDFSGDGLNASTYVDIIHPKGVILERNDVAAASPFGFCAAEDERNSRFYKSLQRLKVPTFIVPEPPADSGYRSRIQYQVDKLFGYLTV